MDMNLFDYFGFEAPEAQEQKEEVKKKTAKKEKAAKGKKTTKAARERKYKLPVTIYIGDKEVTLEEDGEKTETTLTEIKKFLEEEVLGISKDLLVLEEKSNGFIVSVDRQKAVSKGGITLTRNTKITCRGEVLELSSLMEGESTSITLEQVLTAAKANINQALVSVVLIPTGEDSYELAEGIQPMDILEKEMEILYLPFVMGAWGQESVTVTKDDYVKFLKDDLNTEVTDVTLYYENLKQYANKIFPCFGGHAQISVCGGENGSVFVYMDAKEKTVANKTPASKKTDKIPTEGVSIGLIFNKIEVCPEMFDGKTEATKEEYIAFIGSMYPEYSPERCEIQYDKEKKLVIPILKGSRKGAMDAFNPMVNSFVYDTLKNEKEYKIFRITGNDNHRYQVEITPVSTTKAPMDRGGVYL